MHTEKIGKLLVERKCAVKHYICIYGIINTALKLVCLLISYLGRTIVI